MTDRPILFSAPMVRAILTGTKTQTRRVMSTQPAGTPDVGKLYRDRACTQPVIAAMWQPPSADGSTCCLCPHGVPGDRLWVRETWARTKVHQDHTERDWFVYATGDNTTDYGGPWKPSIHMPRAASRITLEITGVRVERLQDISEADALAEGIVQLKDGGYGLPAGEHYHSADPRQSYLSLWEAINGPGSVEANPWLWVVEFPRFQAPGATPE